MDKLQFFKRHLDKIIYSVCGVVTLVGSISLLSWTIQGEAGVNVKVIEKNVVLDEGAQVEYLVGQEFINEGVYLNIGSEDNPKLIPASECEIEKDFSSSGKRAVTLSYAAGGSVNYQGILDVEVYFVRGLTVNQRPTIVMVDEENKTFSTDDSFDISAELATKPKTSAFEVEEREDSKVMVKLTPDMYSTSIVESTSIDNYYNANLYCGDLTYNFSFYNDASKTFFVVSEKDVVIFENSDENDSSKLTLVVTDRDTSYQIDCIGQTQGYYVYENNGQKQVIDFDYELKEKEEVFKSNEVEESKDENGVYEVTIGNTKFTSLANLWQSAVVNGLIYTDGGYKLVVGSDSRILNLNYLGEVGEQEIAPKLNLYVSNYTFDTSTGNGLSQGFYIYTDKNGVSQKVRFKLQTYVWTHVPLSATVTNLYDVSYIGDWLQDSDFNDSTMDNYIGDLYADVRVFERGVGWSKESFTADFNSWRLVAYNMA